MKKRLSTEFCKEKVNKDNEIPREGLRLLCAEKTHPWGISILVYNRLNIKRIALALVGTVFMKIMKKKACLLIV